MKKAFFAVAAVVATTSAAPAFAQSAASATQQTTGSAEIIRPVTLTKSTDLAFGRIVRPSTGSSLVTIDATSGAASISGSDGVLLSGTKSRAAFVIGGEGSQAYTVTVPASFSMTQAAGANPITVNLTSTATTGSLSGALGSASTSSFGVGGNFSVSATTVTGAYSGTFDVTVVYN